MYLREGLTVKKGRLFISGCDTTELAARFGTPLYVMDEEYIRKTAADFKRGAESYKGGALICYASKAFSCKEIYRIMAEEGLGTDVVSGGELFTASAAGMPMDRVYFHGNNKTGAELTAACRAGVHAVVVDSFSEIEYLDAIAGGEGKRVNCLLRLNPGIEAHTHHFVQTARIDSKFGLLISDGSALEGIRRIKESKNLDFKGFHVHIGSQIFDLKPYALVIDVLVELAKKVKSELGIDVAEFNLGGGFGIRYTDDDKPHPVRECVEYVAEKMNAAFSDGKLPAPRLILEPGRSMVAEAGITLYTVGTVKDIKDVKKYVCVDGGMFDNPRYALYQARYTALLASRAGEAASETVTVAGKCCESGDILVADTLLAPAKRGDILAVLATGAYNYSMASNYNRNPVPPVVMVNKGEARIIVRGQTYEDIAARDV